MMIQVIQWLRLHPHYTAKAVMGFGATVVTLIAMVSDRKVTLIEWFGLTTTAGGWLADVFLSVIE